MLPLTCCVTGHRNLSSEQLVFIEPLLRQEIKTAIGEGYTHFISGFAQGVDELFARLVLDAKNQYPEITLEAALPYRNFVSAKRKQALSLLEKCQSIGLHSEAYSPYCFSNRNRYMVHNSNRIIAVHDGRARGGTAATLRYAAATGREVYQIAIATAP